MDIEATEIVYIPVDRLLPDPEAIRPEVGSVADIEPSIRRDGIIFPVDVRPADEEGFFFITEGNRRIFVARKIGLDTAPCHIREVDAAGARKIMMASDLKRAQPHIVVRNNKIIGGLAVAIRNEKAASNMSNQELADRMGERYTSDTIGAYLRLLDDDIEVVKAVASGRLDITAYSRMKAQSTELKRAVLATKKKKISANDVREAIKRKRRDDGDDNFDLPYLGAVPEYMQELTDILASLRRLKGQRFPNDGIAVIESIVEAAEDLIIESVS